MNTHPFDGRGRCLVMTSTTIALALLSACGSSETTGDATTTTSSTITAESTTTIAGSTTSTSSEPSTTTSTVATTSPTTTAAPIATTTPPINATTTVAAATTIAATTTVAATTTTIDPIAQQFSAFVGGTTPDPCEKTNTPPLDAYFGPANEQQRVEVGRIAVFCPGPDWDGFEPIDVVVTRPDGSTVSFQAIDEGDDRDTLADPLGGDSPIFGDTRDGYQFVVRSSHALGVYLVEATQGDLTSSTQFELVPATQPFIELFRETRGGFFQGSIRFALSGFPWGSSAELFIYKDATDPFGDNNEVHEFSFVKPGPVVAIDGSGAGVASVEVDPSLAAGERHCLAALLETIASPVCDNFRGGWFTP